MSKDLRWFVSVVLVSLLAPVFAYTAWVFPWNAARALVAVIDLVLVPGYVTLRALFPRKSDLSSVERLFLSIAFSVGVVPLLGLAIEYTWGRIELGPIELVLIAYNLAIAFIALLRIRHVGKV